MTARSQAASVSSAMGDTADRSHAKAPVRLGAAWLRGQQKARVERSAESVGMDQGMRVLSYLISGVLLYGGLGWFGDHLLHTGFLLPVGIILGAALGCFLIIKRFGQLDAADSAGSASRARSTSDRSEGVR